MKHLILVMALCAAGLAQDVRSPVSVTAAGSITASSTDCGVASCVWIHAPTSASAVAVQLSGTFAATVQFESSVDGSAWTGVSSGGAAGSYTITLNGSSLVRARCSSYSSGTVQVAMGAGTSGGSGGTPPGSNGAIAYNNAGAWGATGCTWDGTNFNCPAFSSTGPLQISGAEQAMSGVSSTSGNATCAFDSSDHRGLECKANASGTVYKLHSQAAIDAKVGTIASGALALATSAIASGACQTVTQGSVNSAAATGTLTTDVIAFTANGSIKAVTGYVPATTGGLAVTAYPTADYVNFDVCNWATASKTPDAVTVNWKVLR